MTDRALEEGSLPSAAAVWGEGAPRPRVNPLDVLMVALMTPLVILPAIAIAIAVIVDSSGSVIYRARRIGQGGREFSMLKFRTMKEGAPGPGLTLRDDERITPLGRLLRKTRLDELPQLLNVLRGEMRLVGPRPEAGEFVARYRDEYEEILTVRPGITGATQLEFASKEAHLAEDDDGVSSYYARNFLPEKVARDLHYVRSRTMLTDLGIVLETLAMPIRYGAKRLLGVFAHGDPSRHPWLVAGVAILVVLAFVGTAGSPR